MIRSKYHWNVFNYLRPLTLLKFSENPMKRAKGPWNYPETVEASPNCVRPPDTPFKPTNAPLNSSNPIRNPLWNLLKCFGKSLNPPKMLWISLKPPNPSKVLAKCLRDLLKLHETLPKRHKTNVQVYLVAIGFRQPSNTHVKQELRQRKFWLLRS